jgi:hypothetical protein
MRARRQRLDLVLRQHGGEKRGRHIALQSRSRFLLKVVASIPGP